MRLSVCSKAWLALTANMCPCSFIGAVGAKRRLVKAFAFMSWLLFFASMGASGLTLYAIFSGKNITSDCIQVDNKGNVSLDSCTTHVSTGVKVAATIIVVLIMIVHLCT